MSFLLMFCGNLVCFLLGCLYSDWRRENEYLKGKVTPDEVMGIISGAKIPFIKWKALDSVLEGKQEEAS